MARAIGLFWPLPPLLATFYQSAICIGEFSKRVVCINSLLQVYALTCLFLAIYYSMSTSHERRDGENMSAYSVFNPNCERLTGTFTAEDFDRNMRRGGGVL